MRGIGGKREYVNDVCTILKYEALKNKLKIIYKYIIVILIFMYINYHNCDMNLIKFKVRNQG